MLNYPELNNYWRRVSSGNDFKLLEDYLITSWLDDYYKSAGNRRSRIVQTSNTGFSYLFDISKERLIAAWGTSRGKNNTPRDKSRMKGHPLSAGKKYHRGHAIPHTLGGGTDINLVAQKGSVNIGAFRILEIKAVNTPGALYFTYWKYQDANTQTPAGVQQGLLCPKQIADIRWHHN